MVISKNQLNLFFSKTSDAFYEGWQSGGWQGPIYSFEISDVLIFNTFVILQTVYRNRANTSRRHYSKIIF